MSALCGCFITTVTLCVTVTASQLLAPQNVQLTSYNMNLRLSWSPPPNETSEVLYSTQLRSGALPELTRVGCVNTTALHCDLSDPALGLSISEFGQYTGSVRAQSGVKMSEWVNSQTITMDQDTVIGPPNVSLHPSGADLEVFITNPKLHISTMEHVFSPLDYNVSYWPQGNHHRVIHMRVKQNQAVLEDLDKRTEYCVQVRVVTPDRNKNPSVASEPICANTKEGPSAPWLAAVLTFVALVLVVVLVTVAVVYRKRILHFLCPKATLPQTLQFSLEGPHTLLYLIPADELCHLLSVVPDRRTEES